MSVRLNNNGFYLLDLMRAARLASREARLERVGKIVSEYVKRLQALAVSDPKCRDKSIREVDEFHRMIHFVLQDPSATPNEREVLRHALNLL